MRHHIVAKKNSIWEQLYGIGSLQAYKLTFKVNDNTIEEYIHCEVLEWVESNKFDQPTVIKIQQIRNLQEYYAGKKLKGHERILRIKDLEIVHFKSL